MKKLPVISARKIKGAVNYYMIHYIVKFKMTHNGEIYYRECDAHNVVEVLTLYENTKDIIEVKEVKNK